MIARQALSFAFVVRSVNAAIYAAYLLLNHTVLDHFSAMTVTFCSGVVIGFLLNRRFTFAFGGEGGAAFVRYVCAYVFGYLVNFTGLWILTGRFGIPHEIVQGWMILGIAILLFLLQKYWVFRDRLPSRSARVTP
jgi:putative flippase GtrA